MSRKFNSGFAEELDGMIDLKVALGYSEGTYASRATSFDRYCAMICPDATELTKSIVIGWLKPDIRTSAKGVLNDASFARAFGSYLRAMGKDAYVIPENYTAGRSLFIPYLFADEELTELFHVIDTYEDSRHPFEPAVLSTYFRLTYTCGLRPNEGRNLKRNEVDLSTGEVFIIDSKWKKSRTAVMSEDMLSLIKTYTTVRDTVFPDNEYLFPRSDDKPYTFDWMGKSSKSSLSCQNRMFLRI